MTRELVLTRTVGDRQLYELADVGTLRLAGLTGRRGTAEADGRRWEIGRRGVWERPIVATDAAGGGVVGQFEGRMRRAGATLRWADRDFGLRREGLWRQRYTLSDAAGRTLATFEAKSYGRRPVKVAVEDDVDGGLLLFSVFVARALAMEAAAAGS